ncbi:570_t:CDS:2 [Cetraspora pellucida]|uniref:570_t:CDS:1 n=1 Tax=Cetraspora pellucida TaxID=1433469 RepID=A0A9N9HNL8_9GLOM|nr:570_t:CDS:2 [Cetraspora pellucida]
MKKLLVYFLVASLLTSLVVAVPQVKSSSNSIKVTEPTTNQKVGGTVDVKWDTTVIPKGLKTTDNISTRIRCNVNNRTRQFPAKAIIPVPFTVGKREVGISDDSDLIGVSCQAFVTDDDNLDIQGVSKKFKLVK